MNKTGYRERNQIFASVIKRHKATSSLRLIKINDKVHSELALPFLVANPYKNAKTPWRSLRPAEA